MSANTGIAWTDATWNPIRGCALVSHGCTNCYAMKQAHRFSGKGGAYEGLTKMTSHGPVWTGEVRTLPDLLDVPLRWKKPRRIFVNSMSDLFHEDVPESFIDRVFTTMGNLERHTFQLLTKRPERMQRYVADWYRRAQCATLPNVHLGVSVENQPTADERIPLLQQTRAAVRYISYEPALGPVDFRLTRAAPLWAGDGPGATCVSADRLGLDWIIIGGESGPKARPFNLQWARDTITQCREAGVACFVKQCGAKPYLHNEQRMDSNGPGLRMRFVSIERDTTISFHDSAGADPAEWPDDLRVREFPKVIA